MDADIYALCECGYFERVPFGRRAHIHASVCPNCAKDVGSWRLVVGRTRGFFGMKLEVIRDY